MDDAGEAFDATYPGAFDNLEELDWHLPAVTDASLLGSAVMSKWDQGGAAEILEHGGAAFPVR